MAAVLAAFLSFSSCLKEPALPARFSGTSLPSMAALSRSGGGEFSPEEQAAIEEHLQGVANFRAQVHTWRGAPTGEPMPAGEVIDKTEIAFNFYLGDVTRAFRHYESVEQELTVSGSESWTPAQIVAFYDGVKAIVQQALEGTSRKFHLLSLSYPQESGGNTVVRIVLHMGINPIEQLPGLSDDDLRWAPAPIGHTPNPPCSGAANDTIGARANAARGFYLGMNAGPSSGNQPRKGVVVSKIVYGVHQLFPLPYNPPIPYPQMYNIPTFGTSLQNLHYNSIAYGDSVPPWNCLTPQQVDNFISGNFALAQSGKQYVPPVKIITHFFDRPWVCTRVVHDVGNQGSGSSSKSKWQQHIVEHYFAVVALPTTPGETLPIHEM